MRKTALRFQLRFLPLLSPCHLPLRSAPILSLRFRHLLSCIFPSCPALVVHALSPTSGRLFCAHFGLRPVHFRATPLLPPPFPLSPLLAASPSHQPKYERNSSWPPIQFWRHGTTGQNHETKGLCTRSKSQRSESRSRTRNALPAPWCAILAPLYSWCARCAESEEKGAIILVCCALLVEERAARCASSGGRPSHRFYPLSSSAFREHFPS